MGTIRKTNNPATRVGTDATTIGTREVAVGEVIRWDAGPGYRDKYRRVISAGVMSRVYGSPVARLVKITKAEARGIAPSVSSGPTAVPAAVPVTTTAPQAPPRPVAPVARDMAGMTAQAAATARTRGHELGGMWTGDPDVTLTDRCQRCGAVALVDVRNAGKPDAFLGGALHSDCAEWAALLHRGDPAEYRRRLAGAVLPALPPPPPPPSYSAAPPAPPRGVNPDGFTTQTLIA